MPVRRKVFRIEEMLVAGGPRATTRPRLSRNSSSRILAELTALRSLIERQPDGAPTTYHDKIDGDKTDGRLAPAGR